MGTLLDDFPDDFWFIDSIASRGVADSHDEQRSPFGQVRDSRFPPKRRDAQEPPVGIANVAAR